MLKLSNIEIHYGNIKAIKGIALEVPTTKIITLLGSNGAGKTTTLNAISGLMRPSSGTIEFEGVRIDGLDPEKIVRRGISQVSEGREIFPLMTVKDNLELGAYVRNDKKLILEDEERMFGYFPILKERRFQRAGTLSGGEQQMLLIARGLMSRPKLLLMDEPSLGLSPLLVEEIFRIVVQINKEGTTILLVEQNARMALIVSEYAYIMENGLIHIKNEAHALLENEEVKKAYLGG
jgi:branched-chain amino acid transport system ATP-binding protein